ncbi:FimV/HubP family polar landmark protein [Mangrovitalea sediminis]|uniref:FimV/HubP family polar landmark protein n=1 Tax=Mangrovitalea sediminis TaxID=1982043 RepID=UPI000BE58948|nr:FimV/HubP family polar landmark protein [Mangrovitalea sediminis]
MKVRKLAIALALVGSLGAEMAQAIGLGDVNLDSHLNEPLRAEINLVNVGNLSTDQIAVSLAPQEDFARAGIHRSYDLSNLNFKIVRGKNGQLVVDVSTKNAVREPYMDFLVQLVWPKGRLLREYTLLIDPPTYNEGAAQPVAAAASSTPAAQAAPQPTQAAEPSAAPAQSGAMAPAGPRTYGPTKASDTLWQIAARFKPSRATTQQMMLAIQDRNPDAFLDHNINLMKKGVVLRLPTPDQVTSRTAHQAVREVIAQNRSFKASRTPIDATSTKTTASTSSTSEPASQDKLRLSVAPSAKQSKEGSHGGGIGGEGEGSIQDRLALSQEQLDKAKRDNAELNSRLQDLQDQVKTLNRLVQLKSDQLSALQNESQKREESAPATTSAAPVTATPQATPTPAPAATPEAGQSSPEAQPKAAQPGMTEQKPEAAQTTSTPAATAQVQSTPAETAPAPKPMAEPVKPATAPTVKPEIKTQPEPAAKPGFPADILNELKNNPLYQIGAGGAGVLLLLALLALARRNAKREQNFQEQLRSAEEDGDDTIEMPGFDGDSGDGEADDMPRGESEDPLSEADVYIAYGRLDQAAHLLEDAISGEPSRSDLRLKLLEVYAESSNREAFDKQFRELEALDDTEALASAEALRDRLQEAEEMPSIDDLESELKTGSAQESTDFGAFLEKEEAEQEAAEPEESSIDSVSEVLPESEEEDLGIAWDLSDEEPAQLEEETPEAEEKPAKEEADFGSIDFDLGNLELEDKAEAGQESVVPEAIEPGSEEVEEEPLDFSLETVEEESGDIEPLMSEGELEDLANESFEESPTAESGETPEEQEPLAFTSDTATPAEEVLDESFLDELDAELEKVTGDTGAADTEEEAFIPAVEPEAGLTKEEESAVEEAPSLEEPSAELTSEDLTSETELPSFEETVAAEEDDTLDGLELDVSDDDLAVLEEAAGDELDDLDLPDFGEEVDLGESDEPELGGGEDVLDVDLDEPEADLSKEAEELSDAEWDQLEESDFALTDEDLDAAAGAADSESLGEELPEPDDEDFDFLAGTDEAATKLDLARAYIEMGDSDGARDILEEVSLEGNDEQKKEAQDLLKNLK